MLVNLFPRLNYYHKLLFKGIFNEFMTASMDPNCSQLQIYYAFDQFILFMFI